MDRDQAVQEVAQGLGMRRDLGDLIIQRLIQAQTSLEGGRSLPWFIINEDSPIELVADQYQYDLSDAFIREVDDFGQRSSPYLTFGTGDSSHVNKVDYDDAVAQYGFSSASGTPAVYALRSNSIFFWPTPDQAYSYRWSFYQKQASLANNVSEDENAWLKHCPYLLIGKAGKYMSRVTRDPDSYKLFDDQEREWTDWLTREMAAREQANQVVVMGADR